MANHHIARMMCTSGRPSEHHPLTLVHEAPFLMLEWVSSKREVRASPPLRKFETPKTIEKSSLVSRPRTRGTLLSFERGSYTNSELK